MAYYIPILIIGHATEVRTDANHLYLVPSGGKLLFFSSFFFGGGGFCGWFFFLVGGWVGGGRPSSSLFHVVIPFAMSYIHC